MKTNSEIFWSWHVEYILRRNLISRHRQAFSTSGILYLLHLITRICRVIILRISNKNLIKPKVDQRTCLLNHIWPIWLYLCNSEPRLCSAINDRLNKEHYVKKIQWENQYYSDLLFLSKVKLPFIVFFFWRRG